MIYEALFFVVILLVEFAAVLLLQRHISPDEWSSVKEESRHICERLASLEARLEGLVDRAEDNEGEVLRHVERVDDFVGTVGNHEGRLLALEARDA